MGFLFKAWVAHRGIKNRRETKRLEREVDSLQSSMTPLGPSIDSKNAAQASRPLQDDAAPPPSTVQPTIPNNNITFDGVELGWGNVPLGPKDAILGITEAFNADPSPAKINLGVGAYRDDSGRSQVLKCVLEVPTLNIYKWRRYFGCRLKEDCWVETRSMPESTGFPHLLNPQLAWHTAPNFILRSMLAPVSPFLTALLQSSLFRELVLCALVLPFFLASMQVGGMQQWFICQYPLGATMSPL